MEENNYQKIIQERYNELPEMIQKIITESDWINIVKKIGEKYSLRIDQIDTLQKETMFVMFGFEEATNFLENIIRETELNRMTAIEIFKEIDSLIFEKIKQALVEEEEKLLEEEAEKDKQKKEPEQLSKESILEEIEGVDQPKENSENTTLPENNALTKPAETSLQNPVVKNSEIIKIDPYREEIK